MSDGRRKEIASHLSESELDERLARADDAEMVRRLSFVKNLYRGDTIEEAATRVGRSEATGDRWADAWNEGGVEALAPSRGGGRPPKLDESERQRLREMLQKGQPWTAEEVQRLIDDEFGVEYHPDYLGRVLRSLGFSYSNRGPQEGSETDVEDTDDRGGGWTHNAQ